MTNSLPNPHNKRDSTLLLGMRLISLFFLIFTTIAITIVARTLGDGSAFSTGYELGRMLKGLFGHSLIKKGLGIGSVIATLASWDRNKSILWAILHAVFGWLYVLYFAITKEKHP